MIYISKIIMVGIALGFFISIIREQNAAWKNGMEQPVRRGKDAE